MSDIRVNRWLHQSGTGGVYQDSSGRVGIGTSIPTSALDVQSGSIKIGSNTLSSSGVSTFTTVNATTVNATSLVGVSTAGITTAYIGSVNDGPISGVRNRIINGDCRIDQRYAGASAQATDGGYFIDRWSTILNNGNFSVQGNAGNITPPVGFTSYFGATVTTAASITGTSGIRYKIEGYNIADFAWGTSSAKTVTMSFWVYSSLTGSFGGAIWNSAQSYSYPFLYTVSQANTWTYITLTIPGSTNGTWLSTNGVGMGIDFSMGTAGTPLGTAGAWVAGYKQGATGQVNHLSTLGATLYITGLQVELGTVATPFERRSFGQELALAQRYYQRYFPTSQEWIYLEGNGSTLRWWFLPIRTPMRIAPNTTFSSGMTGGTIAGLTGTISSLSLGGTSVDRVSVRVTTSTNDGTAYQVRHTDGFEGDYVELSSEL
jgi:hypothetical protein